MNVLWVKFATIEEAEVNFGLTINSILHGTSEPAESPKVTTAFHNVNILTELKNLGVGELVHVLKGTLGTNAIRINDHVSFWFINQGGKIWYIG